MKTKEDESSLCIIVVALENPVALPPRGFYMLYAESGSRTLSAGNLYAQIPCGEAQSDPCSRASLGRRPRLIRS